MKTAEINNAFREAGIDVYNRKKGVTFEQMIFLGEKLVKSGVEAEDYEAIERQLSIIAAAVQLYFLSEGERELVPLP